MKRPILLSVSLCLIAFCSYWAIVTFTRKPAVHSTIDTEIERQAKAIVPEPTLPPRPAGRVVKSTEKKQITKDVAVVKQERVRVGLLTTTIPRVSMEKKTETVNVPVDKLVEASPAAIAAWNKAVADAQQKYEADLKAATARLVEEKKAKERSDKVEAMLKIVKEGIIPLLGAITGLLGAIKAFRSGGEAKAAE